jgi:hypothetical protein
MLEVGTRDLIETFIREYTVNIPITGSPLLSSRTRIARSAPCLDVPVDFAFEGVTRLLLEHQDWDCEDKTDEDTFTTFG